MKEVVLLMKEINQFLYDFWCIQCMCDIMIKVNEKEFYVYKLVLVVYSEKFINWYCEEVFFIVIEVILFDVMLEVIEVFINYIYMNEFMFIVENIEFIIVCVRQLGIKSVLNFC